MHINREVSASKGAPTSEIIIVSGVLALSLSITIVMCGLCQWCQRKLGKRYKNSLDTVGTPDSSRGIRNEKKALNGTVLSGSKSAACGTSGLLDKDGRMGDKQFRNDSMKISMSSQSHHSEPGLGKPGRGRWHTVQSHLASGNLRTNYEDPTLPAATTLDHIPISGGDLKCQRPRTLLRQQSLQQPLSLHQKHNNGQPTTSQSLGQLQLQQQPPSSSSSNSSNPRSQRTGQNRPPASAGSKYKTAGVRNRANPGSWDHVVGQIRNHGLDMKSFLGTVLSGSKSAACGTSGLLDKDGRMGDKQFRNDSMKISMSSQSHHSEPGLGKPGRGRWHTVQSHLASGNLRTNYEDPTLPAATTLDHIPISGGDLKCQRPRTLLRQQSLQQPLSLHQKHNNGQPTTSQSLGQLQLQQQPPSSSSSNSSNPRSQRTGQNRPPASAGSKYKTAGVRNRANPGSWDHVVGQIRNHGLDMKSFLEGRMVVLSLVLGLSEQDDFANIPDLQTNGSQQNQNTQGEKRLPAGAKTTNTTGVPGQGQSEESDKKPDQRSSVSDLVNSLTSEMLMLSPGSDEEDGHDSSGRETLGRIQFSVGYNFQESTLTVKIMKAQELPAKDFSGTSDPFVKIYLLPDKKHKLETKVKRKNLNPHWNETFLFEGFPYEKVVQRVLYLQVLDYDRFSRNDPIGEVSIPLNKIDLTQMQTFWKELKPCSDGSGSRGELLLSLCYNPSANSIIVNIIKARNLKAMDIGGTSDPYVKVWLMYKDKRVEKKKTVVMKRCLNPIFNESFIFDVPTEKLRETTIIITVMDKDRLSRNDVIGKIYLSWKSGPGEVKHWKDMISHPRTAVAQWHQLKA